MEEHVETDVPVVEVLQTTLVRPGANTGSRTFPDLSEFVRKSLS